MSVVLVVDDEALAAEAMTETLELAGLPACGLTDPQEALRRALDPAVRVVVTDLRMPRLQGRGLVAVLGAVRPELRFVVVTGHAGADGEHEFGEGDLVAYLHKPVEGQTLVAAVRKALT